MQAGLQQALKLTLAGVDAKEVEVASAGLVRCPGPTYDLACPPRDYPVEPADHILLSRAKSSRARVTQPGPSRPPWIASVASKGQNSAWKPAESFPGQSAGSCCVAWLVDDLPFRFTWRTA